MNNLEDRTTEMIIVQSKINNNVLYEYVDEMNELMKDNLLYFKDIGIYILVEKCKKLLKDNSILLNEIKYREIKKGDIK